MRNSECTLCPLGSQARTVCVWGRQMGKDTTVMIVGEAPGRQEDSEGSPFVGPSGRLLQEMLDLVGLTDCYITNTVKCFPNGTPKPAEVKACAPYLDEEIAAVKPKYILCLGNTAMRRVIGPGSVTDKAGKEVWLEAHHAWAMPALHPAAILRSPGLRSAWEADIVRFARLVKGELQEKPPVRVHVARTLEHLGLVAELINIPNRTIAYDFEATPIAWHHKDFRPYSVAFSLDGEKAAVVPLHHKESPFTPAQLDIFFARIKLTMTNPDVCKTAHNAVYDDLVWYRTAGYLPHVTFDTMLAAHLLDENRPKSLKWLGRTQLGWPDWDIDAKKEHPLEQLAYYNGCDAAATALLRRKLLDELGGSHRLRDYLLYLTMPALRAIERIIARGVYVDQQTLAANRIEAGRRIVAAKAEIPVVNPGSTKQLGKWLYEDEKLPILKTTDKGAPSTDEETINLLAWKFPQAKKVLDYRRWTRFVTTYFGPIGEAVDAAWHGRSRFHPEYRTAGTETGRLSSFFHTTPRDPFVRSIFAAPQGHTLVSIDFSQIEARLAAWTAAGKPGSWEEVDPALGGMLLAFREGRDIYKEMAAAALGKPVAQVTREERQHMGKVPTLAAIYKISAEGLRSYVWVQYQLIWTPAFAAKLHNTFYTLWPEIRRWHDREERLIRARGWTQSAIGRIRRLPEALGADQMHVHKAVNSGINMPIQSLASDIMLAALILIDRFLANTETGAVVGSVHDALLFEVREDALERTLVGAYRLINQAYRYLEPLGLRLPEGLLKSEVTVGPWGTKDEWQPPAADSRSSFEKAALLTF